MTGCDHGVTCRQTFEDFHLARQTQAHFDRDPLRHFDLGFVALHDPDHKGATALRDDGLFWNDQGVFARTEHRIDAGKHAWAQLLLAVVNATAHAHRASIGIDQRVHRLNDGAEGSARQRVDGQLGFLTGTDLGLKTLGQPEVKQHRIDVLDVDHVSAVLQVIAHVDLFEASDAVKWRQHLQTLQGGLCQRQLGARHFQCRTAFIQRTLADEVLRHQILVAFVVGLGDRQLCAGLGQLGLWQLVVELHHQLAFAHPLAIVEENLFHASADFGAQHHPLS